MTGGRRSAWTPSLGEALALAWRAMLAFWLMTGLGFVAFVVTIASYRRDADDIAQVAVATFAGFLGVAVGQLLSLLRLRLIPIFAVTLVSLFVGGYLMGASGVRLPDSVGVAIVFFCFAFPCGLLSLQHRYELLASFWASIGWIGSAMIILNEEGRVSAWHADKASAWLPVPLLLLAGFVVTLMFYLAAKQSMRVRLWQSLSGALERRVTTSRAPSAVPKRNVLAVLFAAALVFTFTAVLAPYLWRTGRGDRSSTHSAEQSEDEPRRPRLDRGEQIERMVAQLMTAAKKTSYALWPLLILLALYRPTKRALLLSHLKTPIVPTPPSERIDNLWEYVRITAEDAGCAPRASDSIEELLRRMREEGLCSPSADEAAAIYNRTRYGITVTHGDPLRMRRAAVRATEVIRDQMSPWARLRAWFRSLS